MDYIELKVDVVPSDSTINDVLVAQLAELGFDSFMDQPNGFNAYIRASDFNPELYDIVRNILIPEGTKVTWNINRIKDQNWNSLWESNFEPVIVDNRCLVRASFHKKIVDTEFDIVIDPKMAFGTGHHQTTWLMISAMLSEDLAGKVVLDMGCGTGVLAILAELKGARRITAIDIDDWAYRNALENIATNRCNKIGVVLGDVSKIKGLKFDVILANINLNILLNDLSEYVASLNPKGKIFLSGILATDLPNLIWKGEALALKHLYSLQRDNWAMIAFSTLEK